MAADAPVALAGRPLFTPATPMTTFSCVCWHRGRRRTRRRRWPPPRCGWLGRAADQVVRAVCGRCGLRAALSLSTPPPCVLDGRRSTRKRPSRWHGRCGSGSTASPAPWWSV
ncbi:hypothetical protein HBB16_19350 [Pseudonocardia sp. MCCB 268]|nr:hypothetical protein [Pseudonocardia cytotoxica]